MGIHVDDAEGACSRPLVSLSLGCSAVFLVGPSRDEEPEAILLRSGDVVVLSGPARRYAHAVPRIFPGSCPEPLCDPGAWLSDFVRPGRATAPDDADAAYAAGRPAGDLAGMCGYLRRARLNINVRQVADAPDSGSCNVQF